MNDGFLAWLRSESGILAIGGAMGGLVRWLTLREDWRSGGISLSVGAICATYLTPLVVPIIGPMLGGALVKAEGSAGFLAFMVGLGGIAVSGFVIDVWKARSKQIEKDKPQ